MARGNPTTASSRARSAGGVPGTLGGVLAFGVLEVFLGPTLLAIGYALIQEWSAGPRALEPEASTDAASPGEGGRG